MLVCCGSGSGMEARLSAHQDGAGLDNSGSECPTVAVRATAVGRGAERDAERNAVLAGDPKCLVYYVMID